MSLQRQLVLRINCVQRECEVRRRGESNRKRESIASLIFGLEKSLKRKQEEGEQVDDGGDLELDQPGLLLHQHRLHGRMRPLSEVSIQSLIL